MKSYYRLVQDTGVKNRWLLGDILNVNNWELLKPSNLFMEPCRYQIIMDSDGVETDYTASLVYGVPIISEKFRSLITDLPDMSRPYKGVVTEPVIVLEKETGNQYFVMITETAYDCVDEVLSEFTKYQIDDPIRPDKAGCYSGFYKMCLDPKKIGPANIFRIKGFQQAIIVSEEIKRRYEVAGLTGAIFKKVC
jgi:hypothetical protein